MSHWLDALLQNIKVTQESPGTYLVSGIRTKGLFDEFRRVFGTVRFQNGMFKDVKGTSFKLSRFFLFDFYGIVKAADEGGTRYYNHELLKKLRLELEKTEPIAQSLKLHPSKLDYKQLARFIFDPLPKQSDFFKIYDQRTQQYGLNGYILAAEPGTGKATSNDTLVQIPGGWKRMGDIQVGDEVIAADGTTTDVTAVYPQGKVPLYRITFADGRTSEVCGQHLWKVFKHSWRNPVTREFGDWRVVNTLEMLELARNDPKKVFIQLLEPPKIPDKEFSLDPYVLGLFIGDGSLTSPGINFTKDHDYFHSVFDSGLLPNTEYTRTGQDWRFRRGEDKDSPWLKTIFKDLGLLGKLSHEKEIPEEYMEGSAAQRLALINGLLDTDGTVGADGTGIRFTSTSEKLAKQFQYLVRSLGDQAYMKSRVTFYTYNGEKKPGRRSYTVFIRTKDPSQYFRLPCKRERVPAVNQYSKTLKLRVEFGEQIDDGEATCISVSHPDRLFIIQDFVVTHNTFMSLALMAMRKKDLVMVFSPNNALQSVWASTIAAVKGAKAYVYPEPFDPSEDYTHYVFSHENTGFAKEKFAEILKTHKRSSIGIIVDECHKFTEINSQLTWNLIDICRMSKSEDILFMSGTPFKALGVELIPFIMSTDPYFTDSDREGFKKIFGVSGLTARNILAARIGRTLHVIEKSDVVDNDVKTYTVNVKVPGGEQWTMEAIRKKMEKFIAERVKYYRDNEEEFIWEYERCLHLFTESPEYAKNPKAFEQYRHDAKYVREFFYSRDVAEEIKSTNLYEKNVIIPTLSAKDKVIFRSAKSVYKYVTLKIQGEALGQVLTAERSACNEALVKHMDNGVIFSEDVKDEGSPWTMDDYFIASQSKVVMFTDYIEVLQTTEKILKKKGFRPEVVYGETNKELVAILKRFESDPKVNPVIATFKSLSTAVPLIMADTCVFLNIPFRDYMYKQATARVDRLGQKYPVKIYLVQLDTGDIPNISTRSNDIMKWSREMTKELLGVAAADTNEDILAEEEEQAVASLSKSSDKRSLMSKW